MKLFFVRAVLGLMWTLLGIQTASACSLRSQDTTLNPGQWITVVNAPFEASDNTAQLWASYIVGEEVISVPAYANGGDGFSTLVPLFVEDSWSAQSDAVLALHDGEVGCEITGLARAALTPAGGTVSLMLASLMEKAAISAEFDGTPTAEINALVTNPGPTAEESDDLSIWWIDRALSDWTQVLSEAKSNTKTAELARKLDAYFAQTSRVQNVLDQAKSLNDIRSEAEPNAPILRTPLREGTLRLPLVPRIIRAQAKPPAGKTPAPLVTIDPKAVGLAKQYSDPSKLARDMRQQIGAAVRNHPEISATRDTAGTLFGISAALATAGSGGALSKLSGRLAHGIFLDTMRDKIHEGILPSKLLRMEIIGGPYELVREPGLDAGQIQDMTIVPWAKGANVAALAADVAINYLSLSSAKNVLKRALPFSKGAKPLSNLEKVGAYSNKIANRKAETLQRETASVGVLFETLNSMLEGISKQVLGKRTGSPNFPKVAIIPPFEYPPVSIIEPGWYKTQGVDPAVVAWEPKERRIDFFAANTGVANVEFRPRPQAFGIYKLKKIVSISVNRPTIDVSPGHHIVAAPGTTHSYTARVLNWPKSQAVPEVSVELSPGFEILSQQPATRSGETEVKIAAAKTIGSFRGTVTFAIDVPGVPPTERTIGLPQISPNQPCIPFGETVQFAAPDHNGKQTAHTKWVLQGKGNLNASGLYTAPKRGRRSRITINLVATKTGDTIDEKRMRLGCACEWDIDVAGKSDEGKILSISGISIEAVTQTIVQTLDGKKLTLGLTAEGGMLNPKTVRAVVQDGPTSWVSGQLFSSLQFGKECELAKTSIAQWRKLSEDWLYIDLRGTVLNGSQLSDACSILSPYSAQAVIRIGKSKTNRRLDRALDSFGKRRPKSAGDGAVKSIASGPLEIRACLPER